jgi:enoyl-CoA hydratase
VIAPLDELRAWAAALAESLKEDVRPLLAGIERAPIAVTVLKQLLDATDGQPIEAALTSESLAYSTLQGGPEYQRWLSANRAPAPAAHSDEGEAVVISRDGDSLDLELNRPSLHNAMTIEMRDALIEALELALADETIARIRIRGRGKCFSTGGDLTEFGTAPDPATAHIVRSLALPGRLLARLAARAEAHLHGACVGSGVEFPVFAGRVVAKPDTWFQLPELQFGLIPGAGGCVSIPRRVGKERAAWMILSGKRVDARRALAWGLVDQVA